MAIVEVGDLTDGDDLPGSPVSFWVATTPETDYPTLPDNLSVDVAVLGGGITGITTAYIII